MTRRTRALATAAAVAGATALVLALLPRAPPAPGPLAGPVAGVADGDTITVRIGEAPVKVRIAEIDAPERGQPFGQAARRRVAALCREATVTLVGRDTDRYGRLVADVRLPDGRSLGEVLVAEGLAWRFDRYSQSATLAAVQAEAQAARRGLWADPAPVPPWAWRARNAEAKDGSRANGPRAAEPHVQVPPDVAALRAGAGDAHGAPAAGHPTGAPAAAADPGGSSRASGTPVTGAAAHGAAAPGHEVRARAALDAPLIGNRRSRRLHRPGCPGYATVAPANRIPFESLAAGEAAGYRAAGNCPMP